MAGKGGVGELGLLHAQHVGPGVVDPLLDARQAGVERVHVPGGDAHASRVLQRPLAVHDDEEELGLTGQLAVHRGRGPVPVPARADRRPSVTSRSSTSPGNDLAAEAGLVDPAEERQPAGEAVVAEDGDAAQLGQGLDHEHARQGGTAREVAGEEGFVAGAGASGPGRAVRARGR